MMQNPIEDFSSLEYLETISNDNSLKEIDTSILAKAKDYNVLLDKLEALDGEEDRKPENNNPPKAIKASQPAAAQSIKLEAIPELPPYAAQEDTEEIEREYISKESHNRQEPEVKSNLENITLSLRDLILKVFAKSPRLVAIISDDKIVYVNATFLKQIGYENEFDVIDNNFFQYVSSEYWDKVSVGIGGVLTEGQVIPIGLKNKNGDVIKVDFEGIYIPDDHSFSFILLGTSPMIGENKVSLYNSETGLPIYQLFEDRVKVALRTHPSGSSMISFGREQSAVGYFRIENPSIFEKREDKQAFKKILARVLTCFESNYTLAHGSKENEYCLLIPQIDSEEKLTAKISQIKSTLEAPLEDNFTTYQIKSRFGVCTYPEPADSYKKLLSEAYQALESATMNDKPIAYFGTSRTD